MTPAYLHGFMSRMLGRPYDNPVPIHGVYSSQWEEWHNGWNDADKWESP